MCASFQSVRQQTNIGEIGEDSLDWVVMKSHGTSDGFQFSALQLACVTVYIASSKQIIWNIWCICMILGSSFFVWATFRNHKLEVAECIRERSTICGVPRMMVPTIAAALQRELNHRCRDHTVDGSNKGWLCELGLGGLYRSRGGKCLIKGPN